MLRLHFDDPLAAVTTAAGLTCDTARTHAGTFRVVAERDAVVRVEFAHCADPLPASPTGSGPAVVAARWIERHFDPLAGRVGEPDDVDVRFRGASPFDRAVWRALVTVPSGTTVTYGELAATLGRPGAARAVGGSCARNPVPLLVPCHRIVAAGGPGGYAGGVALKQRLLRAEVV